jgi:voltage-gated potassium channel
MVLITLTTVGYEEVLPLAQEPGGRAFTMLLLVGGMGVSFYFLSSLTAFIIEGDLREVLWRRRMQKRLDSLKNHYIVCGAGRTGRYVTLELLRAGCEVVVIEREKRHFDFAARGARRQDLCHRGGRHRGHGAQGRRARACQRPGHLAAARSR